jgi:prepilin-type processing-associated H-X9-DG protein
MAQTPLIEARHDGGFIVSFADGHGRLAFDQIVLAATTVALSAGTVLGVNSAGQYEPYASANSDGSQTAVAILYAGKHISTAVQPATVVARLAEVNASELIWANPADAAAGTAQLHAVNIVAR